MGTQADPTAATSQTAGKYIVLATSFSDWQRWKCEPAICAFVYFFTLEFESVGEAIGQYVIRYLMPLWVVPGPCIQWHGQNPGKSRAC